MITTDHYASENEQTIWKINSAVPYRRGKSTDVERAGRNVSMMKFC